MSINPSVFTNFAIGFHRIIMSEASYHIIVIIVGALAVVKGFHSGFTGQVSGVLGFAFGTVCTHVFSDQADAFMRAVMPWLSGRVGAGFIYSVTSSALVYGVVYLLFKVFTKVLRSAMQVFYVGMLDKLLGAGFCLMKYMLVLSIFFNLIVCVDSSSPLMKCANADDGNVVEGVMLLAPGLLGCHSFEDLAHLIQLREARKISFNINPAEGVIEETMYIQRKKLNTINHA